jgi:hypothetical protein
MAVIVARTDVRALGQAAGTTIAVDRSSAYSGRLAAA